MKFVKIGGVRNGKMKRIKYEEGRISFDAL